MKSPVHPDLLRGLKTEEGKESKTGFLETVILDRD